jgi:isochorismate pyruvate lyase
MARTKARSKAKAKARAPRKSPRARVARKARPPQPAVESVWPCSSLEEIRGHIDRLDDVIAPLLCARYGYVVQAAQFKPSVEGVVVPARVEEIIGRVRRLAERHGVNPDSMEEIYRNLIAVFTRDEQRNWRKLHP